MTTPTTIANSVHHVSAVGGHITTGEVAIVGIAVTLLAGGVGAFFGYRGAVGAAQRQVDGAIAKEQWLERAKCYTKVDAVLRKWERAREREMSPAAPKDSKEQADVVTDLDDGEASELEAAMVTFGTRAAIDALDKATKGHSEYRMSYGQWIYRAELNKNSVLGTTEASKGAAEATTNQRADAKKKAGLASDLTVEFEKVINGELGGNTSLHSSQSANDRHEWHVRSPIIRVKNTH